MQIHRCEECGYEFQIHNLYNFNGKVICNLCIPENHTSCKDCHKIIGFEQLFNDRCKECNLEIVHSILKHYESLGW